MSKEIITTGELEAQIVYLKEEIRSWKVKINAMQNSAEESAKYAHIADLNCEKWKEIATQLYGSLFVYAANKPGAIQAIERYTREMLIKSNQ